MSNDYIIELEQQLEASHRRAAALEQQLSMSRSEVLELEAMVTESGLLIAGLKSRVASLERLPGKNEKRYYPERRLLKDEVEKVVERVIELLSDGREMTLKQLIAALGLAVMPDKTQFQSIVYKQVRLGRLSEASRTGFNELVVKLAAPADAK